MSESLKRCLADEVDWDLARSTRVHPLPRPIHGQTVFIKREDELSSGIAGSKLRKYASLSVAIERRKINTVAAIGGPNSNNLVGLAQFLAQKRIKPYFFIRASASRAIQGNALLLRMLCSDDQCQYVSRQDWPSVETVALRFLEGLQTPASSKLLIPEGALMQECLMGCLSLPLDLLENETRGGHFFSRIFVDAGTGMTAIGLLIGLAVACPRAARRVVCLTLLAGRQKEFEDNLARFAQALPNGLDPFGSMPRIEYLKPPTAASFGVVNKSILRAVAAIAKEQGILMDPVYSAKHYLAMSERLARPAPRDGQTLFIYNGSSLGLCGFLHELAR